MAKNSIEVVNSNLAFVTFSEERRPDVKKNWSYNFVNYGKKNDFPNELIRYFEEHAEHGAIVNAKSKYLFGKGLIAQNPEQQELANTFLNFANRYESWNDLGKKLALDCELFNSFYLQIITDMSGKPKEFFQLQYAKCRLSECKTKLYYNEDWVKNPSDFKVFELYKNGQVGTFFTTFKFYQPSKNKLDGIYAKVPYNGCLSEIKSDIDITTFNDSYVKKGFSAGTMVTFFNGEQAPEVKRQIKERFERGLCSPDNAGEVVINFADKNGQAAQIQALNVDDLDKKFEFISKRYQQKIITGHNITNPELFGIKQDGSALGNRVSIKESHELFLNTYIKPRQDTFIAFIEKVCFSVIGINIKLDIEQLEPIGFDLSNDADLTQDERRKLKGYEPLTAPKLDNNGVEIKESEVNNTLTNLTGRQFQGLMRIVNKFDAGKLSKESALALMVSGFGLSKEDALTFLNENDNIEDTKVQMQSTKSLEDCVFDYFSSLDTSIPEDIELELVSQDEVHIHNSNDALKFESEIQLKFADNKDSFLKSYIKSLIDRVTGKKKNEVVNENPTELITKYHYALKADAPALKGNSSRPFCVKMMALDKEFTFEQLDSARVAGLSNGFDEIDNIWDYRGGYYTNPNTKETTPWCRHIWAAKTYKIKKK